MIINGFMLTGRILALTLPSNRVELHRQKAWTFCNFKFKPQKNYKITTTQRCFASCASLACRLFIFNSISNDYIYFLVEYYQKMPNLADFVTYKNRQIMVF